MNFNYQDKLVKIWNRGVELYQNGHSNYDSFPITDDLPFLKSIGLNKIDIFDYVEDWICEGAPDLATFLLIHDLRRDYFLEEQNGIPSKYLLNSSKLPGKQESIEGITWLPRIIPKAIAKLRGELPPETMYCCGGDRAFFKNYDIHPAEFLRIVKRAENDNQYIINWVIRRIRKI